MKYSLQYLFLPVFTFFHFVAAAQMFRGDASHQGAIQTANNVVYDYTRWKFDAGAPVRSTVLGANNALYFGTSSGIFYCIDPATAAVKWTFNSGSPIHSSAAFEKGKIFFTDNRQRLYALDATNGKVIWTFDLSPKLFYGWKFDYWYSSPLLTDGKIVIGGEDGFVYCLSQAGGKMLWKFKTTGIVRSTAAARDNNIFIGDTEGILFSINLQSGKEVWRYATFGNSLKNEDFGFDRKAIISSPAVSGEKIITGGRDGLLYCVNAVDGKLIWKVDHDVSWVCTSVSIADTIVVTGTSDGRFAQAVHLQTGRELWKRNVSNIVWASPFIHNNEAYIGTFDGQLLCFDIHSGKQVSQFYSGDRILSSPLVYQDKLFFGSDDGYVYALQGRKKPRNLPLEKYVFYEPGIPIYFRNSADLRIKNYLAANGFLVADSKKLVSLLKESTSTKKVIVFATNYFPPEAIKEKQSSLMTKFVNTGNRVVLLGNNPAFYTLNDTTKRISSVNYLMADTVFGIRYEFDDTRTMGGQHPVFATPLAKELGLPGHWTAAFNIEAKQADVILGKEETGLISSWIKKYINGGQLVQLWIHQDIPMHLDGIIKVALNEID